ncbi:MAG TPA: TlpA disulfide reductase family protein [Terriglobales bacterium]|nr:TlpA disulfide reductase family protein [Terriglobales bacterium]
MAAGSANIVCGMRALEIVLACAVVLSSAACGLSGPTSHSASRLALPPGFTRSTDQRLGFDIGLAPGWKISNYDSQGSVAYSGPADVAMVVHFEEAASSDLSTAAAVLLAELTAGSGLTGARLSDSRLAGRPAKHATGQHTAGAQPEGIQAYLMIDGRRAWEVAMAGPPAGVTAATEAFDAMATTFRLVGAQPTPPPRATVGLPAPGFPALDRSSGPVVINFFATWCADCRGEMPVIAKMAAESRGRFTLLAVDCCDDQPSSVSSFLQELGVKAAFRNVTNDRDGRIAQAYGLLGPPTTAFLDKDHVLRQLVVGPVTAASLQQGLHDAGAT